MTLQLAALIIPCVVAIVMVTTLIALRPKEETPSSGDPPLGPKGAHSGSAEEKVTFVLVRIPDPILPTERSAKYEGPLSKGLAKEGLGKVTGGGTEPRGCEDIDDLRATAKDAAAGPARQAGFRLAMLGGDRAKPIPPQALSKADVSGNRTVESIGLALDITDIARAIPFLKRELARLGAPPGTQLEFKRDGQDVTVPIHP